MTAGGSLRQSGQRHAGAIPPSQWERAVSQLSAPPVMAPRSWRTCPGVVTNGAVRLYASHRPLAHDAKAGRRRPSLLLGDLPGRKLSGWSPSPRRVRRGEGVSPVMRSPAVPSARADAPKQPGKRISWWLHHAMPKGSAEGSFPLAGWLGLRDRPRDPSSPGRRLAPGAPLRRNPWMAFRPRAGSNHRWNWSFTNP